MLLGSSNLLAAKSPHQRLNCILYILVLYRFNKWDVACKLSLEKLGGGELKAKLTAADDCSLKLKWHIWECYPSSNFLPESDVTFFYIMSAFPFNIIAPSSGTTISAVSVFLLTMNADHVLQDQDPLSQDLQGLPELLHSLSLNHTITFIPDQFSK